MNQEQIQGYWLGKCPHQGGRWYKIQDHYELRCFSCGKLFDAAHRPPAWAAALGPKELVNLRLYCRISSMVRMQIADFVEGGQNGSREG